MPSPSYHQEAETLSCTQFKLFDRSPQEYYHTFVVGDLPSKDSTTATETGTIVHAILLEKKSIFDLTRTYPSNCLNANGGLIGKAAAEFRDKIFPVIAIKDDQVDEIEKIVKSAYASQLADVLNSGATFEKRLDATIEGVPCRCCIDIHAVIDGVVRIWDLKTTERIAPVDWNRTAKQFQYPVQDAFYSLIAEAVYDMPSIFRFWAIEVCKLHRIAPYFFDDRSREIAKDYVKRKLGEFAQRKESGNWEDHWEQTMTIGPWTLGQNNDNEMVEFEG